MVLLKIILSILLYGTIRGAYYKVFKLDENYLKQVMSGKRITFKLIFVEFYSVWFSIVSPMVGICILAILFTIYYLVKILAKSENAGSSEHIEKLCPWNGLFYPFINRVDGKIIAWLKK